MRVFVHIFWAIILLGFVLATALCLTASTWFSFDRASALLAANANLNQAAFYDLEYHLGVISRARLAGLFTAVSCLITVGLWKMSMCNLGHFDLRQMLRGLLRETKELFQDKFLLFIMLASALLRFRYLFQPGSSDEVRAYFAWTARPLFLALADYRGPQHLFYILLDYPLVRIFGNAEWVIRLPAFVAGIALIPLIYIFVRKTYSQAPALLAAVLVAFNPMWVHYSVMGRGYTVHASLTVLLWISAISCSRGMQLRWLVLLILTGFCGLYTLPVMMYVLLGTYAWLGIILLTRSSESWTNRWVLISKLLSAGLLTVWLGMLAYLLPYVASDAWYSIDADDVSGVSRWIDLPAQISSFFIGAWQEWNMTIPGYLQIALGTSFLIGLKQIAFFRTGWLLIANLCGILAVLLALRIVPYPRVILYISLAYWIVAAVGLSAVFRFLLISTSNRNKHYLTNSVAAIIALIIGTAFLQTHNAGFIAYGELAPGIRDSMYFLKGYALPGDHMISAKPAKAPVFYYHLRYNMNNQLWMDDERSPPLSILQDDGRVFVIVNSYFRQSLPYVLGRCGWPEEVTPEGAIVVYSNAYTTVYHIQRNML